MTFKRAHKRRVRLVDDLIKVIAAPLLMSDNSGRVAGAGRRIKQQARFVIRVIAHARRSFSAAFFEMSVESESCG